MVKVITYGSFDLFHEGHYKLLQRAKDLGDYLIVGVTTEHFDMQRGKLNVADSLLDRIENVKKTGFADEIIIEDHDGQKVEDILKYDVDIFTLGSDWAGMFDYLREYCKVIYLERTPDISSSQLREGKYPIIQLGIVGTGRIAPRFLAEAKFVSGVNVRSVYNPHGESAQRFAENYELESYSESYEEFLDAINAVYIASTHQTHYEYAKAAIEAGKHVLCEKPLTFCVEEAERLYDLAKEKNVVLMEGIKTAYCPGFAQMINLAKSGVIGEIRDVEACFSRITDPSLREMVDDLYGGAFLEFGSYTLLPIFKLFGCDYEEVVFDSILAENGVDLYTKIHFRYKDGLAMSKTGIGVKSEGQLVIAGTKGYILAESPWWLTKSFEVRYEDPGKIDKYSPKFLGDGLRYEISDFVLRINGKGKQSFYLTRHESIAMAGVVEQFIQKRAQEKEEKEKKNKESGVRIWAHRGCSFQYPENTLPALEAACRIQGLAGVELDIQMTNDGEIVVFHDESVDRVMEGSGMIKDHSLQSLSELSFRNWTSQDGEKLQIPTMCQVLERLKPYCEKQEILINIELKNSNIPYEGMEDKILQMVREQGMESYVIYSSFLGESLIRIKEKKPDARIAILNNSLKKCLEFGAGQPVDAYHPGMDGMDAVKELPEGAVVRVYNTREPFFGQNKMKPIFSLTDLKEQGVTDLFTNMPENYL